MSSYHLTAFPSGIASPLTQVVIEDALSDATVKIEQASNGGVKIEIEVSRPSHEDALNEIETVLWQLGWRFTEAVVQEWLDRAAQSLVLGAAGALGGARLKEEFGLIGLVIGLIGGALAPPLVRAAEYQAARAAQGWQLHHVGGLALRPAPQLA